MRFLQCFGHDTNKIIAANYFTDGIITGIKTCWWMKINKKPVRTHALDGAVFPHIISFTYRVNEKDYTGSRYVHWDAKCPQVNDRIVVYYDHDNPAKYAVNI